MKDSVLWVLFEVLCTVFVFGICLFARPLVSAQRPLQQVLQMTTSKGGKQLKGTYIGKTSVMNRATLLLLAKIAKNRRLIVSFACYNSIYNPFPFHSSTSFF